jgi:SIR2-like domain
MQNLRRSDGYKDLLKVYSRQPIVVFAGAGATLADSTRSKEPYGVGTWDELLDNIVDKIVEANKDENLRRRYEQEKERAETPWDLAEWISRQVDGDQAATAGTLTPFHRLIIQVVRGPKDEQGRHRNLPVTGTTKRLIKQLPSAFLEAAPTMNAIAAFCGRLAAVTGARFDDGPYLGFRVEPNQRVRALVTPNFDPYLEAAASRKYKRDLLKPVAAVDSSAENLRQIPVFHVHGYVPFPPLDKPDEQRGERLGERGLRRSMVLTRSDYEREQQSADAYSPTLGPQVHLMRHYPTLFIGFSFSDQWIKKVLQTIHGEGRRYDDPGENTHRRFAIVNDKGFSEERLGRLSDDLGVVPVVVKGFSEVPTVLGSLYEDALERDLRGRPLSLQDETRAARDVVSDKRRRRRHQYTAEQSWRILHEMRDGKFPTNPRQGFEVEHWLP